MTMNNREQILKQRGKKMFNKINELKRKGWFKGLVAASILMPLSLTAPTHAAQELTPQDAPFAPESLDAFIEGEMTTKMKEFKVAGATMALVHQGKLIYAKGFGDADVETGRKVVVDDTLFRWGSISKTFTWTAIMQLVEQGKIDLEADVNDYLQDISIHEAFDGPVRVKHLLAHTPGFEDAGLGHIFEHNPDDVLSLKDYLLKYQPKRVRPAGEAFSYSNYGTALAGQIIENVSGMRFEDYVQANIFKPLGMNDATFLEPVPERLGPAMDLKLQARLSKAFLAGADGPHQADWFTFGTQVAPAGTILAPATDMAKFAQAHLEGCALNGARILRPETCALMHSVLTPLNAGGRSNNLHGFFQHYKNAGHNRFGHNGGIISFHSQMGLYPDLDFAFLLSTNTDTGPLLYKYIEEALVKHLFGDSTPVPEVIKPAPDFAKRADKYVGFYQSTRRNYSTIEILYSLFQGSVKITLDPEGYLLFTEQGKSVKLVEVKPNLFREIDKENYFEFVEDASGSVVYLKALRSFDKVAWYAAPENRLLMLTVTLIIVVIGLMALAVRSLKRFSREDPPVVKSARRRLMVALSSWIIFIVVFVIGIIAHISANDLLTEFPSPLVVFALALGVIACLVSLLPTWSMFQLWRERAWGGTWRSCYSLLVVAVWLFVIQLNAIHLIGFNYMN